MTGLDVYVRGLRLERDKVTDFTVYPFAIPAIRSLDELALNPQVTFFVGDNGSGKSTLIEAIAILAGFNAEGGSRHFNFATRRSDSDLKSCMRLVRGARRPRTGYFLRAESYFNVASEIERRDEDDEGDLITAKLIDGYGGRSLHEQSHGESFLALLQHRFHGRGLYILDEPEAALSPQRQLSLLSRMHELVAEQSQFIIATHSPILMAYPDATIYQLGPGGITEIKYEETEHYQITRDFLNSRERYFKHLFSK